MRTRIATATILVLAACVAAVSVPARAQLLDSLKGAAGIGQGGSSGPGLGGGGLGGGGLGGGGLGGLSMSSVGSASGGNIAGVLRFCVQNNYLGGNGASSVENRLTGKLGSAGTPSNPQFASGAQGVLQTGQGRDVSLGGGGGLKQQMTQKACKLVLQHAKSLI